MQWLAVAAIIAQIAIEPSFENISASVLVVASSTLTIQYLRLTRAFNELPVSAFAVLGLCVTTQWGALVAQSAVWTPISDNLWHPLRTFAWLGVFQAVAVFAHLLFRRLRFTMAARDVMAEFVMRPLGVFSIPSPGNIWVMGSLGALALLATGTTRDIGVEARFIAGFSFLTWAPFIIPVLWLRHGSAYCDMRLQGIALGMYFTCVVLIGLGLNYRSVLFVGLVTALLLYLLLALGDERPARPPKAWKILIGVCIGSFALAYASDVATAMAIARKDRGNASLVAMVEETFRALADRRVIEVYREADAITGVVGTYSEVYISNEVVARLVETKFHDNMLHLIQGLRPAELDELRRVTHDRFWGILPRPVLAWLGVSLNKEVEQAFSMGDFFDYLKHGNDLGGFKTGSVFGHGLALFPNTFPLIYFLLCMSLFVVWDMQSQRNDDGSVQISPAVMLFSYRLFTWGITGESLSAVAGMVMRSIWQNIALYLVIYWCSRLFFKPFDPTAMSDKAVTVVARRRT